MKELISGLLVIIAIIVIIVWGISYSSSKKRGTYFTSKSCKVRMILTFIAGWCYCDRIFFERDNIFNLVVSIFCAVIWIMLSCSYHSELSVLKEVEKILSRDRKEKVIDLEYEEIE